jgi:predicted phosphodiesterase
MSVKWTKREEKALLKLASRETLSHKEIATNLTRMFGVHRTRHSVKNKLNEIQKQNYELDNKEEFIEFALQANSHYGVEEVDKFYNEVDLIYKDEKVYSEQTEDIVGLIGKPRCGRADYKVVSISDLHIPHLNLKCFNAFLKEEADADIVVINGDISDSDAVSFFKANNVTMPIVMYDQMQSLVSFLAKRFPLVILVSGNHDTRMYKYFLDRLDFFVSPFIHNDLLSLIIQGYEVQWDSSLCHESNWLSGENATIQEDLDPEILTDYISKEKKQ